MAYEPPNGSTMSGMSVSSASTCCVRTARRAARSVGSPRASSKELVWSDWVPPSTAARAARVTRTRLTSGCWAVSSTPAVWVWNRSLIDRGSWAPNCSLMMRAHSPPSCTEFGDLLEHGDPGHEEERQPRSEIVDGQPGGDGGSHVLDGVGQREGQFLHG